MRVVIKELIAGFLSGESESFPSPPLSWSFTKSVHDDKGIKGFNFFMTTAAHCFVSLPLQSESIQTQRPDWSGEKNRNVLCVVFVGVSRHPHPPLARLWLIIVWRNSKLNCTQTEILSSPPWKPKAVKIVPHESIFFCSSPLGLLLLKYSHGAVRARLRA